MTTYNTKNFYGSSLPLTLYAQVIVKGTTAGETLVGTSARDVFYGNGGADNLIGGSGDDTYVVQYAGANIVEQPNGGIDTVKTTANYVLPNNVENLFIIGTTGYSGTTGIGNSLANLIVGDSYNQYIEGGGGNDVLIGGGGSDTFIFGHGSGFDAINDFQTGSLAAGGDVIRLQNINITSFSEFKSHLTQQGADTLLTLSSTDKVLIRNTHVSDFTSANVQPALDRSLMKLTFAEEFNSPINWYNATTKTGKWLPEYGYGGIGSKASHDVAPYTGEENIFVDPKYGGSGTTPLGLNPFSQSNGIMTINSGVIPVQDQASLYGFSYYSGMLSTVKSFTQTYGYFEMSAKLPKESGAWPAFWMEPVKGNPPELDILEAYGPNTEIAHTTVHDVSIPKGKIGNTAYVPGAADSFHTYGVLWTAKNLTWYIDGQQVFQQATPADMNQPMYMIVSLPIGGVGGTVDPNHMPTGYQIDYIHAYSFSVPISDPPPIIVPPPVVDHYGTAGADILIGGAGNDVFYVNNAQDIVREDAGQGFDTVYTSVPWTVTAGCHVDKIILTGSSNANLIGNGLALELDGNAGINTLTDGGGAAVLKGGLGNDTYIVANASTVVVENANEGFDTVKTSLNNYTLPKNVENLTFTGIGSFHGVGNATNGTLTGGRGDDTLVSGTGAEKLVGGGGNDTFYINNVNDTVVAAPGGNSVVYTSVSGIIAAANISMLTYTGTGDFTGYANAAGTKIVSGAGSDMLVGGGGSDVLDGGGGNNILSGGVGADVFRFNAPATGINRITDFVSGTDHIQLSSAGFHLDPSTGFTFVSGSNPVTIAAHPSVLYNTTTGALYFDPTGADNHDQVQIAVLDHHPLLTINDFLIS